jgi:hypothetical protein
MLTAPPTIRQLARTAPGRELLASLAVLAAVFAFALATLAAQGNWPKVLRVSVAACSYLALVAALAGRWWPASAARSCPYWVFAVAGAVAGALGIALRPGGVPPLVVAVGAASGAALFGAVHWLALRTLRRTRAALLDVG